ncbi:MAG: addiction module protein [Nitrospirae bacterium]|nr:addiction module protein [Nitrospirota bacterium]
MSKMVEVILRESMQLSAIERAHLVDELLTTLETEKDEDADAAWAQEVEKRSHELSSGKVQPVIWDEVRERARHSVHGKSKN